MPNAECDDTLPFVKSKEFTLFSQLLTVILVLFLSVFKLPADEITRMLMGQKWGYGKTQNVLKCTFVSIFIHIGCEAST